MKIAKTLVFLGPNVWSRGPVLEVLLEPGGGEDRSPGTARAAIARLERWLVALTDTAREPFADATHPADVLWRLTIALQQLAGEAVRQGWHEAGETCGCVSFAVEFVEEDTARRCLDVALRVFDAARWDEPFPLASAVEELREHARETRLGRTTGPIVAAARARDIPAMRLDRESLVQLGHGSRQRRIRTAVTCGTGFIAEAISRDKSLTKQLLRRLGIPVPAGRLVADEADAWAAACEIGLPVVVKPLDADFGNGVSLRLMTRDDVAEAYQRAREFSPSVLVETLLPGAHHRVLVVGERVVAALRREASQVIGDGERSVAALLDAANRDPQRGADRDFSTPWFHIAVDDETERSLKKQNLRLDSIPTAGQCVLTRWTTADWNGDALLDVTDELHPDVAETIVDAVRSIGLDIAGVDLIATDIRRPLEEQHGGILEINAEPAILIHMHPVCRPPRPVPEAIISHLFPHPEDALIPIVAICGNDAAIPIIEQLHEWLDRPGQRVGSVRGDGVFIGQRRISVEPQNHFEPVRALLLHPGVDTVVCQLPADAIRQHGLPFDRCHAALLLNLRSGASPSFPGSGLDSARVLIDSVAASRAVVVNVDDRECESVAAACVVPFVPFSMNPDHVLITQSRRRGGRAVFVRGETIILAEGPREFALYPRGTTDHVNLAAIATGWVLGIEPERMPAISMTRDHQRSITLASIET